MRKNDTGEQLSISRVDENKTSMAVFSPLGGQILELSLNGRQIIGGYAGQDTMAQIFGYTMAPWPNRLADGAYRFRDQFFQVEKLDEDNNANHGLVLKQQMEVISHSADSLTLLYSFGEDKCYPFALDLEIKFSLQKDSLLVTSVARNNAGHSIPFALGFHPYFTLGDKFDISADFSHRIETDKRKLPIGESQIGGIHFDQDSQELASLDDCFYGASEVIINTNGFECSIKSLDNFRYFMLYRPNTKVFDRFSAVAIEPMSHQTNVFNTDIASTEIAAGDEKVFSYEIRIR